MAKADKCPWCNSSDIKRTATGWVEEGIGAAIGAGISALASSIGISHTKSSVIREGIPTEYKCNRCGKEWHTTSSNGEISVLDDDAPQNKLKIDTETKAIKEKTYSCSLIRVGTGWWNEFNTRRLLNACPSPVVSWDMTKYVICNLPYELVFKDAESLQSFKKDIKTYGGMTR